MIDSDESVQQEAMRPEALEDEIPADGEVIDLERREDEMPGIFEDPIEEDVEFIGANERAGGFEDEIEEVGEVIERRVLRNSDSIQQEVIVPVAEGENGVDETVQIDNFAILQQSEERGRMHQIPHSSAQTMNVMLSDRDANQSHGVLRNITNKKRSPAASAQSRKRKRRQMESNPDMRPKKKSEQEKKAERNKKWKLSYKRKKKELAEQLVELRDLERKTAERNEELEILAAEQQAEINRQNGQLAEYKQDLNNFGVRCMICLSTKPTRVWQPCAHACCCDTCLEELLRRNPDWERNNLPCPLCEQEGLPLRIYM